MLGHWLCSPRRSQRPWVRPTSLRRSKKVENTLPDLAVVADLSATDLALGAVTQVQATGRLRWSAQDNIVQLEAASATAPDGSVRPRGAWTGTDASDTNRVSIRIDRLDLARLSQRFRVPIEVASIMRGEASAVWPGLAFDSARADARLEFASKPPQPSLKVLPVSGVLRVELRDRHLHVWTESLQALATEVSGSIDLAPDRSLTGSLRAAGDIRGMLAGIEEFRGSSGPPPDLAGNADLAVELGGPLDKPTGEVLAEGSRLRWGSVENASLQATAHYNSAQLELGNARLRWQDSEVNASGRIGLEEQDPTIVFEARSGDPDLPTVLGVFGQTLPVGGSFALAVHGSGTLAQPQVAISARGRDLRAYGEDLGVLAAQAAFANRTLRFDSFRLERDGGAVTGTGAYDLSSRDYTVQLNANEFALRSLELPQVGAARGSVDLKVSGSGNVDRPALDFSMTIAKCARESP